MDSKTLLYVCYSPSRSKYVSHKCHCLGCKAANAKYMRELRARRMPRMEKRR